jgi:hypothetical protein
MEQAPVLDTVMHNTTTAQTAFLSLTTQMSMSRGLVAGQHSIASPE